MNPVSVSYLTLEELRSSWQEWQKQPMVGYAMMADAPLEHLWDVPAQVPDWETLHAGHGFIWEANLCEPGKRSIAIRQLDDKWQVTIVDEKTSMEANPECIEHRHLVKCRGREFTMILKEAWLPQPDAACENMEVLRAAWVAFAGFEPEQEGEKR